jgi:DNA repair protein RadC
MSTEKRLSIKDWGEEDRPREKLMLKGKQSLSDAELIGILIGSGSAVESAVSLSQKILNSVQNNLIDLGKLSMEELMRFKGIGEAKALTIIASMELGRRRRESEVLEKKLISSSKDVFEYFQAAIADIPFEEFWVLFVNRGNRIIGKSQISQGGVSSTVVDPKRIFYLALQQLATGIILCHNHPSGNIKPSQQDIQLTKKIIDGAKLLDISVLDHIIVGDQQYYSFADEGILNN